MEVHHLGLQGTWMLSQSFGFFGRYETRIGGSGGFRYAFGSDAGDVATLSEAHLRSMSERNTIVLGIVL
jgi:hypothetical protein